MSGSDSLKLELRFKRFPGVTVKQEGTGRKIGMVSSLAMYTHTLPFPCALTAGLPSFPHSPPDFLVGFLLPAVDVGVVQTQS